ncbi:MAG TPA: GNAT family N-acetyltransferase [Anaerolineae bacterium]|nr:GNAT family N-acetyltransferase [Anaerolineae bacterium]
MQITFIRDAAELDALSKDWNNLLARAVSDVPFLRHEFQSTWWSTLGGGEWEHGELWIGVGRDERGELIGLAPLFLTQTLDKQLGLMFVGSIEISDYLDFIVTNETVEPFVEALLTALEQNGPREWQVLDLYNIPQTSPSLQMLKEAADRRSWAVTQERLQPCPVLTLDGTWEEYLTSLDKKQRQELRRKMRRATRDPSGVKWNLISSEGDSVSAAKEFLELMTTDLRKVEFLTPAMRVQFQRLIQTAHENGWLHLSFLDVGSKRAAGYLSFDYGNRLWVYNSGVNAAYLSLSPGWVLLGNMIRWAIENGRHEFDFLRGDESYKYQLGGQERYIYRLAIARG